MKWTNNLVLEFLSVYKKHSVIWDPKNVNYKNRKEMTRAWNEINEELGVESTVEELKKKKESLMTLYRTVKKKVSDSKKSGFEMNKESAYKPTWFAFPLMDSFLKGTRKNDTDTLETETDYILKSEDFVDNTFEDNQRQQISPELVEVLQYQEKFELETPTDIIVKPHICNSIKIKRKSESLSATNTKLQKRLKSTTDELQSNPSFPDQEQSDDCCLYGQLLAAKLRAMDRRTRTILINKIDNLVFKTELRRLDPLSTQYYSESSSNSFSSQLSP